jgi:hypothetical protein
MRLSTFTISLATAVGHAQTMGDWDPNYPVCLEVYGFDGPSRECVYNSMAACQVSASGRPAGCVVNGYYARGYAEPEVTIYRHRRRHHRRS